MTWIAAEFKPEERELIAYWLSKRVNGAPPRLADLDVAALRPWLALLQIHERVADGFLCRLSGTACIEALGSDSTGKRLDQVVPADIYTNAVPLFERALASGLPLRYGGHLAFGGQGWRKYHRLLLPFAQHGQDCDTLLSRIEYEEPQGGGGLPRRNSISASWELREADLRAAFPDRAAA